MFSRLILVIVLAVSAGCTTTGRIPPQPIAPPEAVFNAEHLKDISVGRFCRVHSKQADTLHEGIIISVAPDAIVLSDAVVMTPRMFGSWKTGGTEVTYPDAVTVRRETITSVDVYDDTESERLATAMAKWRPAQKRVEQNLKTIHDPMNNL